MTTCRLCFTRLLLQGCADVSAKKPQNWDMALAKGILVFQAAGFGKKGPKLELRVATPQKKTKKKEKGSLADVQRLLWSAVHLHALHIAHDQSQ